MSDKDAKAKWLIEISCNHPVYAINKCLGENMDLELLKLFLKYMIKYQTQVITSIRLLLQRIYLHLTI